MTGAYRQDGLLINDRVTYHITGKLNLFPLLTPVYVNVMIIVRGCRIKLHPLAKNRFFANWQTCLRASKIHLQVCKVCGLCPLLARLKSKDFCRLL